MIATNCGIFAATQDDVAIAGRLQPQIDRGQARDLDPRGAP